MMQHNPSPSPVWLAVDRQDFAALVGEFNGSLADLPDDDLPQRNEAWYCSMFQALLVGAGVPAHPRVANSRGATDLVVQLSLGTCSPPNSIILDKFSVTKAGAVNLVSDTIYSF